ncbi:hypothetical protein EKO23_21230 [Nocardioides guangzhouensis]|uniref:Uncharacterized protein n=1 Tax=Nocardioides guangzhouensis TaxID=2497878 RepID=A0A4Q4Z6P0_9ACTN|nr:AGE family epimerase/isomerase [Nocardioides guangzhouensis]RYP82706.1 hypothetical protein EKO23_21230 [Nocardioides guangzhouensis]
MVPHLGMRAVRSAVLLAAASLASAQLVLAPVPAAEADPDLPPVLGSDTWLAHHRDELMPYWLVPEAFGDPVGNFPSFRGTDGELLPEPFTHRGASTLGRGVYGYSLAFMLTGDERYLTYARAGLDWIEAKLEDPVHGGYFGELDATGKPVDDEANKDLFDLASVGLGYAMYVSATRDPEAEAKLLAIRDLVFGPYYDPAANRLKDSMDYTLSTEVDTGGNGGDITNYLVPGTAFLLPTIGLLGDPDRNRQLRTDLRNVTQALIDRHKHNGATVPANRWMFWGRTGRVGNLGALQTDFGHTIKSYAMIHNANQLFADRPWSGLVPDRTRMLDLAWDDVVGRWNQRLRNFTAGTVEPDSTWWIHDEADQLLAAVDLTDGVTNTDRLARSTRFFLDSYVDHVSPVHETFIRVARDPADNDLRKSAFGKNMLHNMEHALILYLHGRALEGRPARLYYALPHDRALTAETRPYWFDSTGQERTALAPLGALPGHDLVAVDYTGIGQVPRPPYPPPADTTPPTTTATLSPQSNDAGWNRGDVTVSLTAEDDLVGVKELRAQVRAVDGSVPGTAFVRPGARTSLTFTGEGRYLVTYRAVDLLGNAEPERTVEVKIDRTDPTVSGLPEEGCRIWPPDHRFVPIAEVVAADSGSGVVDVRVSASPADGEPGNVRVVDGRVWVRAELAPRGRDRTYTVTATAVDLAGNPTTATGVCVVSPPGDRTPGQP